MKVISINRDRGPLDILRDGEGFVKIQEEPHAIAENWMHTDPYQVPFTPYEGDPDVPGEFIVLFEVEDGMYDSVNYDMYGGGGLKVLDTAEEAYDEAAEYNDAIILKI